MSRGSVLVTTGLVGSVLGITAMAASASWSGHANGSATAQSTTIDPPSSVAVGTPTPSSVTVTPSGGGGHGLSASGVGYVITRTEAATRATACTIAAGGASCNDTTATPGHTYQYSAVANYKAPVTGTVASWTSASTNATGTTTIPLALVVSTPDLLTADDSGSSSTDDITKVTTPRFTGTATSGATVNIFDGATQVGTGTATGGTYTITVSALSSSGATGSVHTISAKVTNGTSTVSSPGSLSVTVDTTGPAGSSIAFTPSGTPAGVVSSGDRIAFTFTEPPTPGTLISGWNGTGTQSITVTLRDGSGSNDTMTFGSLTVGSLDLGDKNYTATATATATASVTMSASTVTVTLTSSPSGATQGGNGSNKSIATWTSPTAITDAAGNPGVQAARATTNIQLF